MSTDQIHFAIKDIKEMEFLVNEEAQLTEAFDLNYHVDISVRLPIESIILSVTASYYPKDRKEAFMRGRTATTFLIQDMKKYSKIPDDKESIDLPNPVWITMFSVAFSHARALLARSSAGTKYGHMLMPLINPEQEFYRLFGPGLEKLRSAS